MNFAIVIEQVRLDFRPLLLAITFKYIGRKASIIGLVIITLGRFAYGLDGTSIVNLTFAIYVIISLNFILNKTQNILDDFKQLVLMMMNNLMTSTIAIFFFLTEWSDVTYVVTFFWLSHFMFLFFSYSIIKDFRNMMTSINYDRLTKLNNQHRFHQAMDLINQMTQSVSLAAIDIDHFKFYNDTYGHEFGDQVLQKFSEKLLLENNHNVSAYRVGGEEFALVITGLSRIQSEEIVREFHQHFQNTTLEISGNQTIELTVSIGIAHREEGEQSFDTFRRADKALYFSKENGRNRITVAPSGNISPPSELNEVVISND